MQCRAYLVHPRTAIAIAIATAIAIAIPRTEPRGENVYISYIHKMYL